MMVKNYRPASAGMLPALPGTYLVTAYFDDNQVELVKCNVMGWSVSTERTVTPIVIDPRAADEEPWHVIHSDGRVECSDGRGWKDVDSWIADERRRRRERPEIAVGDLVAEDQVVEVIRPPVPSGMPVPDPEPAPVSERPPSKPYAAPVL